MLVSLYYQGGPAANDVVVTDEQMDSDRSDYLDAVHSRPPYSDMLEEPDYMCGPSRCRPSQCHPTHEGEDEDDSADVSGRRANGAVIWTASRLKYRVIGRKEQSSHRAAPLRPPLRAVPRADFDYKDEAPDDDHAQLHIQLRLRGPPKHVLGLLIPDPHPSTHTSRLLVNVSSTCSHIMHMAGVHCLFRADPKSSCMDIGADSIELLLCGSVLLSVFRSHIPSWAA